MKIGMLVGALVATFAAVGCAANTTPGSGSGSDEGASVHIERVTEAGMIDLGARSVVYEVDTRAVDAHRVLVHAAGENDVALDAWIASHGITAPASGSLRLAGNPADLAIVSGSGVHTEAMPGMGGMVGGGGLSRSAGDLGFTCSGTRCSCSGDAD